MATQRDNPWDHPEWHGLAREASLATGLICTGVNGLGRATYADLGPYYVALFGISNGVERLGKLVFVVDHRLTHGTFPDSAALRGLGHRLVDIFAVVQAIESTRNLNLTFKYPTDEITDTIVESLTVFADAARGRYANFESLNGALSAHDPISYWWSHTGEAILQRHFYGSTREQKAIFNASLVDYMAKDFAAVLHHSETGEDITTMYNGSLQTAKNAIVQQYGRFYVLRLVRWMSDIFGSLTSHGAYQARDPVLFGHEEHVSTFRVTDEFLLRRKRWPLS